jgi:hypothetical protein
MGLVQGTGFAIRRGCAEKGHFVSLALPLSMSLMSLALPRRLLACPPVVRAYSSTQCLCRSDQIRSDPGREKGESSPPPARRMSRHLKRMKARQLFKLVRRQHSVYRPLTNRSRKSRTRTRPQRNKRLLRTRRSRRGSGAFGSSFESYTRCSHCPASRNFQRKSHLRNEWVCA